MRSWNQPTTETARQGGSVAEQGSAGGRKASSMSAKGTHTEPPHRKAEVKYLLRRSEVCLRQVKYMPCICEVP